MAKVPVNLAGLPQRVCAVVVLFHPDSELLGRLIESARGQVEAICLVDNTPASTDMLQGGCGFGSQLAEVSGGWITCHALGRNVGIAAAQNVGIREAFGREFTHVLLLDQDSVLAPETVRSLEVAEKSLLDAGIPVAAVGATYVDVKTQQSAVAHRYRPFSLKKIHVQLGGEPVETDWLIASGSLIRCDVLRQVGLMREELFIDLVDAEWGLRARSLGLLSFLVPKAPLTHSIGDDSFLFFGKKIMIHKEVRLYYYLRNLAYLVRFAHMGWRWRTNVPPSLLLSFFIHSFHADHRLRRARLLARAIMDGLCGRVGPLAASSI